MKHEKSFDKFTPEELKEVCRRAGLRSGEVRRAKRAAIEKEKIQNAAIRESQRENLLLLQKAIRLAGEIQKNMEARA